MLAMSARPCMRSRVANVCRKFLNRKCGMLALRSAGDGGAGWRILREWFGRSLAVSVGGVMTEVATRRRGGSDR